MDLTQGTFEEKRRRSKKHMMLFGMLSMTMTFAGLTSAYVVSKSRKDWLEGFEFPNAFLWSTIVIVLSSITFWMAKKAIDRNNHSMVTLLLISTLVLGIAFVYLQFFGFGKIIEQGFFPTGSEATVTTSFIYAIVFVHIAHVMGGLIALLVIIYNHFKQKYSPGQALGLELGAMYWHFVDFLWVYLFLFLYFFR